MRKLLVVVALAGAMAAPSVFAAFDGSLTISAGTYESSSGGEFTLATTGLGTFESFCLERSEYITVGGTYDYNMNTGAVEGGAGATATDPHTGLPMDNISIGTAWLYSQFRAGNIVINSTTSAGAMQDAIWMLEGEETYNAANSYLTLARTTLGLTDAQLKADNLGTYQAIALNLFNGPGYQVVQAPNGTYYYLNQDMLAIPTSTTPVPEPPTIIAGALLLLPFGASTLRILRKRRIA